jgi:hypothetical protein
MPMRGRHVPIEEALDWLRQNKAAFCRTAAEKIARLAE